ncbi:MAG: alkaline phosphatase family protein [Candidatus Eisenbacteria bacterium]|nr:alkaline phosphatase family protein [Candidatus Eisenbacteria bacterium]
MTEKTNPEYRSPMARAVLDAYRRGEEDEAMNPLVLYGPDGTPAGLPAKEDSVIFYDIRGEREIELTQAFVERGFRHFPVREPLDLRFATMIRYHEDLDVRVAFPPEEAIAGTLGEAVSRAGLRQAKVVETEKSVHLSYFLNGKRREPFPGEERFFIESPAVADYSTIPGLHANEVADRIVACLEDGGFDLIVANFANIDVLGHIENAESARQAVETVDRHLGRVTEAARRAGVETIITADHGTVEHWLYPEGTVDTGHTTSPVPFVFVPSGEVPHGIVPRGGGSLIDVAPTVLALLGVPRPSEMTGRPLFECFPAGEGKRRVLLVIADGWGHSDEIFGNLIAEAYTPNMDRLRANYPSTLLAASGEAVGLPKETVGNSEAGHLHLGAGRVLFSDRLRIDRAIADGSYRTNEAFLWAMDGAAKDGKTLHLLGIVSFFSSHGSLDHLMALLEMAKERGVKRVCVHSLLGRRGERPEAGAAYIEAVDEKCAALGLGRVCTVTGRYWALDREENWDRVEKAYRAIAFGDGRRVSLA